MQPTRKDQLFLTPYGDELLVFDHQTHKAHSLNSAAATVFSLCDGSRTAEMLCQEVAARQNVTLEQAQAEVEVALEQLSHRGLLIKPVSRASAERRISRRQILRELVAAAVVIPVVVSLAAPSAAAAVSPPPGLPIRDNDGETTGGTLTA